MKKIIFITILAILSITSYSQRLVIKNNLLYDATLTPNLGLEIGLGKRTTLDINGGYNPFTFNNNKKFKHWLVQPEFRWWFCDRFNGLFLGLHLQGGEFCVAALDLPFNMYPELKDHRYEGYYYGGGISIGYQWLLSKRWNFETSIGGGYTRVHFDEYYCKSCSPLLSSGIYNYWGITKATISFIFVIL